MFHLVLVQARCVSHTLNECVGYHTLISNLVCGISYHTLIECVGNATRGRTMAQWVCGKPMSVWETNECVGNATRGRTMGWLWLVGSLKHIAEYSLLYRALLQKRHILLGSLLIVVTSYCNMDYTTKCLEKLEQDFLWTNVKKGQCLYLRVPPSLIQSCRVFIVELRPRSTTHLHKDIHTRTHTHTHTHTYIFEWYYF